MFFPLTLYSISILANLLLMLKTPTQKDWQDEFKKYSIISTKFRFSNTVQTLLLLKSVRFYNSLVDFPLLEKVYFGTSFH